MKARKLIWKKTGFGRHDGYAAGGLHVAVIVIDCENYAVWLTIDVDFEHSTGAFKRASHAKAWAQNEWDRLVRSWTK